MLRLSGCPSSFDLLHSRRSSLKTTNEYNDRVLRGFFQEDQDIGQSDVLMKLASVLGLNGAEFKAALETQKYRTVHQQAVEYALRQIGINSVPTFMIGDRILSGLLSKETLEQAISAAIVLFELQVGIAKSASPVKRTQQLQQLLSRVNLSLRW